MGDYPPLNILPPGDAGPRVPGHPKAYRVATNNEDKPGGDKAVNEIVATVYEGTQVRIVMIDGNPWWAAKDVCELFGDTNYRRSVARLDDDEKGVSPLYTPGGIQEMAVVNEAGLYSLLFNMQPQQRPGMDLEQYQKRVKELKKFRHWVTHEVLPTLRKTGRYEIQGRRLPGNYVEALEELLATEKARLEAEKRLALQAPKVAVYDAAMSAKNSLTMEQVAKALGWGRNSLFRELRSRGILLSNNLPYQNQIDCGRFVVRVTPITINGQSVDKTQTLVTPKGLDYLSRLLGADGRKAS